jgi:hypothetical protein
MHGKLKGIAIKRRLSFWQITLLVLTFVFTYELVGGLRNRHVPDKWGTAVLATLVPFCFVIYANRQRRKRSSLWASLGVCFAVHAIGVWIIFQYMLSRFGSFSFLLWYPFMLIESVVLLIAVKRIEERISGHKETIRLTL